MKSQKEIKKENLIFYIKSELYLKFPTSISWIVHKNSKIITLTSLIIKEAQIFMLFTDSKILKNMQIDPDGIISKIKIMINPGFLFEKNFENFKEITTYSILVLTSINFLYFFFKVFFFKKKNQKLEIYKSDAINIYLGWVIFSIPMITFFSGLATSREKMTILEKLTLFPTFLYLLKIYLGISSDFDRRILKNPFGCKRSNIGNSRVFMINAITISTFYFLRPFLGALSLSMLVLLGFTLSLLMKSFCTDFICQRVKNIELSVCVISFWASVVITSSIIYVRYFAILSVFLLILALFLKLNPINLNEILTEKENSGRYYLEKIERLLHLSKHKSTFSKRNEKIIENLVDSYTFEEYMEELINMREEEEEENKLEKKLKNQRFIKTEINEKNSKKKFFILNNSTLINSGRGRRNSSFMKKEEKKCDEKFCKFIFKEYQKSINKFSKEKIFLTELKISLCYFLHDFMNLGKESHYQMKTISLKNASTIENEIEVSRLKNLIQRKNKEKNFIQEEDSKFDSYIINSTLDNLLEKASFDYQIFWLTIKDVSPSIHKIRKYLLNSYSSILEAKKFWERNSEILESDMDSLILYGTFLKNVLNERKKGEEVMQKGRRKLKKVNDEKKKLLNIELDFDIDSLPEPICVLERGDDEIYIKSLNHHFALMLGYQKMELLRKNLTMIIHENSVNYYRRNIRLRNFMVDFDNDDEDLLSMDEFTDQEALVFKNKNGYLRIFPVKTKIIFGSKRRRYFVIKFEMKIYVRPHCYVLVNQFGKILNHNETFSQFFHLDYMKSEENGIVNLDDISPEFSKISVLNFHKEKKISFVNLRSELLQDFYLKIVKLRDSKNHILYKFTKLEDGKNFSVDDEKLLSTIKLPSSTIADFSGIRSRFYIAPKEAEKNFEFIVNKEIFYQGFFISEENRKMLKTFILNVKNIDREILEGNFKKRNFLNKLDFSEGIITKRLHNGFIVDLNEFSVYQSSEENSSLNSSKKKGKNGNFGKFLDSQSSLDIMSSRSEIEIKAEQLDKKIKREQREKRKEAITNLLDEKTTLNIIKRLRFFSFIILLFSLTGVLVNVSNLRNTITDLKNYIKINGLCASRNEMIKFMYQNIFDIAATNEGIYPFYTFRDFYTKEIFLKEQFENYFGYAKRMDYYQKEVFHLYNSVGAKDDLGSFTHADSIKMELQQEKFMRSFHQFFQMAKSVSAKIEHVDYHKLNFTDVDVKFIQKNFIEKISTLSSKLRKYVQEKNFEARDKFVLFKEKYHLIFAIRFILGIAIFIFFNTKILKIKNKRIKFFTNFNKFYIENQIERITTFFFVQDQFKGNHNDIEPDFSKDDSFTKKGKNYSTKLKKKRILSGYLYSLFNIFNFFIVLITGVNYFLMLVDLQYHDNLTLDLANMAVDVVQFSRVTNRGHFIFLSMSEMLLHPADKILGKEPVKYYLDYIKTFEGMYDLTLKAVVDLSSNDDIYKEKYFELLTESRCGVNSLKEDKEAEELFRIKCDQILNGILKYTKLETLGLRYKVIHEKESKDFNNFGEECQVFESEKNITRRNLICLFTSKMFFEIKLFQTNYLYPLVEKINSEGIKSSERKMEKVDRISILLIGVFISSEIFVFIVILLMTEKSQEEMMKFHELKDVKMNDEMWEYFEKILGK